MEFFNKTEIQGIVGRTDMRTINDKQLCSFSVVVETPSHDRYGNAVVDVTWFNVTAIDKIEGIQNLDSIQKGTKIHIIGRFRSRKYVDSEGSERTCYDVLAHQGNIITEK